MKLLTKSDDPGASLGIVERLAFASGNFGNGLFAGVISSFLLFFYTDYIGLNAAIVGVIFMVVRITDGFTDLIMGHIVDRTRSKYGKGRVWLLRMCVPYAVTGTLLFLIPANATAAVQYTYVAITYTLVSAVITTSLSVPYGSMAALITENSYERGLMGIFTMFSGTFSTMVVAATTLGLVSAFGDNQRAWVLTGAVFGLIGIAFHLICFFGTKERVSSRPGENQKKKEDTPPVKDSLIALFKNKYWVMFIIMSFGLWMIVGLQSTALIYYCNSVLGDANTYSILANIGNVAMMVFLFISFIFMKKIGKENTFKLGVAFAVIGAAPMIIFPDTLPIVMVCTGLRSAGAGLAAACMTGMLADIMDYGEWKFGISTVGLGMAANSASTKLGSGISASLWGLILQLGGYDGTLAEQSTKALNFIKIGYIWIPIAVAGLALILALQFHNDKIHDQICADLAVRRGRVSADETAAQ